MTRPGYKLTGSGRLYDLAKIHDGHPMTHERHAREVVSDKQVRDAEIGLQIFQEVEDLAANGHIQG